MASKSDKERGWEKVQIKAFTSWLNGYLKERNLELEDIKQDLSDGTRLINFLELLSGKKIGQKFDSKPDSRIKMIQNLHIAIQFLENSMGMRVTSSAENFADQNLTMILGTLWTLFKKFRIQTIKVQDKSSEEGLLLWVKNTTVDYKVDIESYKQSFKDGLAFSALCDKFIKIDGKDTCPFDFDSLKKENGVENLNAAFDCAEKFLGVPKLLDAQDVADGNIDERSMVLYVSLYFHAYVAKQQQLEMLKDKEQLEREMQGLAGNLEARAKLSDDLQKENLELTRNLTETREARDKLNAELEEERRRLEEEKQNLENERKKAKDLEASKMSLEQQLAELKAQLDAERADRKKENDSLSSRSRSEVSGLNVLKVNLENHVEDLNRWMKFLDLESSEVDFGGEIRPKILQDITKENFENQVKYLAEKLAKENEEIEGFLKQKEIEAKAKKANEKKKKDRQNKIDD